MKKYIFTHNEKTTRNGWSYQAVKVMELTPQGVKLIGERHYTFEDKLQAVCNFLVENVNAFKKFPKDFKVPDHAELNKERDQLHYSNGYTQNYPEFLLYETRYTQDKKILIQEVTLPDMRRK